MRPKKVKFNDNAVFTSKQLTQNNTHPTPSRYIVDIIINRRTPNHFLSHYNYQHIHNTYIHINYTGLNNISSVRARSPVFYTAIT